MLKLMNSAMMPTEGNYQLRQITQDEFCYILTTNLFESSVGYPETADFIRRISGVSVPVTRTQISVQKGDTLLICKLKYRLVNPGDKGKSVPTDDDYEFFVREYTPRD